MDIRVGAVVKIHNDEYVVESIYKREHTRHIHENSATLRKQARAICHILQHFETDEFIENDVVTENLEEVRMKRLTDSSPLVIHKHTYRKETPLDQRRTEQIENDRQGLEGERDLRQQSTSEDRETSHQDGRIQEASSNT